MKELYNRYSSVALFYLFALIVHIILISIMTFFHFRLDHKLIVVENWIFDFAWSLNLISKVGSFILFWKFFHDQKSSKEVIDKREIRIIDYEVLIYSLMCFMTLLWANKPRLIDNVLFSFGGSLIHFVTVFFVFILDILIFRILLKSDGGSFDIKDTFVATAILSLYNFLIFPYMDFLGISLFSLLLINFLIFIYHGRSIINNALFIVTVICPIFAIFGNDPIWGGKFSAFSFNPESKIYYLVLAVVMFIYFIFFRRRVQ